MKLKTSHAMMLCALALLAAQPVWAAKKGPSANMKVLGTITPGSCSVTVGGQGMFDYGNIAVETITDDEKGTPFKNDEMKNHFFRIFFKAIPRQDKQNADSV